MRLAPQDVTMLDELSDALGLTRSDVFRLAVREMHAGRADMIRKTKRSKRARKGASRA